ncbi:MAG: hypothetical protein LBB50_06350, partial [Oscillospiraceae bacterium]|nr:hypothetical protein [Oscillospiraceae bacterium]
LIFCTEGEPRLLPPLIPLFSSEKEETPQPSVEDYGFALCGVLAAQIGGTLRREADDAGLRLFLKI